MVILLVLLLCKKKFLLSKKVRSKKIIRNKFEIINKYNEYTMIECNLYRKRLFNILSKVSDLYNEILYG